MEADLVGRRLFVAGDPRAAAAVAGEAFRRGAIVTLATGAGGESGASTEGDAIRYDGASELDIERAVDIALERIQGLDGLIVAIETGSMPPLAEEDLQSWERGVMQPLRTTFWLARRGVHELLAAGRGGQVVFVNVSGRDEDGSGSGWIVEGALLSLARSIAKEYGRRGITCNVVAGGSSTGAQRAAVEAALFLASPAAGFVTGECLHLTEDSTGCEST
jgi:3-oxoacyl-[acyl-carrier protein] reductase